MKKKKKPEPIPMVLIVDCESSCWAEPKDQPPGQKNEIIELGLTTVMLPDLNISNPVSILVKPTTSKISAFCTSITTLTQELVDTGVPFKEMCEKLIERAHSKNIPWVSWSHYDRKQLMWQCNAEKAPYPFGAGHQNLKSMFATMMGLKKEVGLEEALKMMGLEFRGTRHRAGDESWNIARLMVEMYARVRRGANDQQAN
jgi:inhibitor of KinA sporulation pathway (predicted exonuclease)